MKKILGLILLLISVQMFGQDPPGYQHRIVRERIQGSFMVDSTLHIPRYCGTPSGVRGGGSIQDGALAIDTCNNILYYYSSAAWIAVGTTNIYNSNGVLTSNRTLTGLNNTYSLNFDSLSSWRAGRNGVSRFSFNSTTSSMVSQNTNAAFTANPSNAIINYIGNAIRVFADSSTSTKLIAYETNINGSLTTNALTTKSYVDSLHAAGGTTPTWQQVLTAGSILTSYNLITHGTNQLEFTNSLTSNTTGGFLVSGTGSGGLAMRINTTGRGLYINGSSGGHTPLEIDGKAGGFGLRVNEVGNGIATYFNSTYTNTNSVASNPLTQESMFSTGTAAAGIGFSNDKNIQNSAGSGITAVQHIYKWTTATASSETAQYIIKQRNAGSLLSTYFQNSGRTDTVATLYDVRVGGGGGSDGLGLLHVVAGTGLAQVNDSTIRADTSIANANSITSNARAQKLIDSLKAALLLNFSQTSSGLQYDVVDNFRSGNSFGFSKSSGGTASSAGTMTTSDIPTGWMYGINHATGTAWQGNSLFISSVSGSTANQININSSYRYNAGCKLRLPVLSDNTDNYSVFFGFSVVTTDYGSITNGATFRYTNADSSGKWIMRCTTGGNTTEVTSTTTVAANTDYELEISIFGGSAYFYINGTLAGTISTNVPTGNTDCIIGVIKSNAVSGTSMHMYVDWAAEGFKKQ
jgi:hypothetical protein